MIDYVEFAVHDPDEAKAFYGRTLESWEDRFDAYLVAIGFDTISLAVGRPPVDLQLGYARSQRFGGGRRVRRSRV